MSGCKYVDGAYLSDGEPCRTDGYGDPTRHCTARRSCAQHVGPGELTCARCVGRTRADIRRIVDLAPLMLVQAVGAGVESEAANLAGPAADVRDWSARRIAMRGHLDAWHRLARITERQLMHARGMMEDDDEQHPYTVLARWQMMFSEDYNHPMPERLTVTGAGGYLERNLHGIAQDPAQDFPLFSREMRDCRNHLEGVLRNSAAPERGAPCEACKNAGHVVRLVREYGHWCTEIDCERFHFSTVIDKLTGEQVPDTSNDWWVCPRDRSHRWSHEDYGKWIEERTALSPIASV